jgi:hypothetical protein
VKSGSKGKTSSMVPAAAESSLIAGSMSVSEKGSQLTAEARKKG